MVAQARLFKATWNLISFRSITDTLTRHHKIHTRKECRSTMHSYARTHCENVIIEKHIAMVSYQSKRWLEESDWFQLWYHIYFSSNDNTTDKRSLFWHYRKRNLILALK